MEPQQKLHMYMTESIGRRPLLYPPLRTAPSPPLNWRLDSSPQSQRTLSDDTRQTAEGHSGNHFLCSFGRFSSLFSYSIPPWMRLGGRRPFQRPRTAAVPISHHCHSRLANVSGPRANPSAQRVACFLLAVAFFLDDNSPRVGP